MNQRGGAAEPAYGWVVVAGAFVTNAMGFGILYSFTIFFNPILEEFGGGRGGVSIIASVAAALMLGSGGLIGKLAEQFGPRRMILGGAVLLMAGLVLASMAQSIGQIFVAYGVLLGLGVGSCFLPANAAVGQWFSRRRGLATGIAVAGSGVGSVILAPISQRLIDAYDWRVALRVLGVVGLVVLLGAAAAVRGRTKRARSQVLKDMRSDRTFRILYLSAFVASYGYWVPFVHIVPYGRDHGLNAQSAALLVSVMGIANIVGRVVLGAVADKVGRRRILQVAVGAMTISMLLWPLADGKLELFLFAGAYGFVAGTFISLLFAITADYFGIERLAGITGLLNTAAALGTLLGAPVTGFLFDRSGTYSGAILIAAGSMLIGSLILMSLPKVRLNLPEAA